MTPSMAPPGRALNQERTADGPHRSALEPEADEHDVAQPNSLLAHELIQRSYQPPARQPTWGGRVSDLAPLLDPVQNAARRRLLLQTKLEVGAVDDPLEREADSIAQQVVRTPTPGTLPARRTPGGTPTPDDECTAGGAKHVARVVVDPTTPWLREAPPSVDAALAAPGRSLDEPTRTFFESRLGVDLKAVRVHADADADASTRDVEARAYTVGTDIVFGFGQYQARSESSRALLAHELAHVMQQGRVRPLVEPSPLARERLGLRRSAGNPPLRSCCAKRTSSGCAARLRWQSSPVPPRNSGAQTRTRRSRSTASRGPGRRRDPAAKAPDLARGVDVRRRQAQHAGQAQGARHFGEAGAS
jgi:hypothetical protein